MGDSRLVCATCGVTFQTMDELRKHFSSEWHLHNVRLRVEGKPRVTEREFKYGNAEHTPEAAMFSCTICKKQFKSIQTLQAHVKSTEHLMQKEKRILARDSEAGSMLTMTSLGSAAIGLHRRHKTHAKGKKIHEDPFKSPHADEAPKVSQEDREADCDANRCFFCGHPSESIEENLAHMKKFHAFTLPLPHRITNKAGLMDYLARKINGLMCLVCNDKTKMFQSLSGLRDHMKAANHEYLVLTSEYDEFYSGTLDDGEAKEETDEPSDKLVVATGTKVIRKREGNNIIRHREGEQQTEQRRLITAQQDEAMAIIKKERAEMVRKQQKVDFKISKQQQYHQRKFDLKTGLRANKLHPKGHDGEGEVNSC